MKRLILPVMLLAGAFGCDRSSPEARIRKAFEACIQAVEAGDAGTATADLSPRFEGPEGMDRPMARMFLVGMLSRQKVGVTVLAQKMEVVDREAVQTVDLLFTGREGNSLLPGESSRRAFRVRWEVRDGKWLIREVQDLQGGP